MKLLVTGGAGYLGSIVANHLVEGGDEVVVLDSLYRGHREAVPDGARLVEVDLLDAAATNAALAEGFDGVMHFAALALVAESVVHPERYYRGNVVATLNLLDAMREAGVRNLVFSSTTATYGEPDDGTSCSPPPPPPTASRTSSPSPRTCHPTRSTPTAAPSSPWTA
jgi:UDP-glucose 4-epimerase